MIDFSLHQECALLAAVLYDNEHFDEVADYIAPEDFQLPLNQYVYRVIKKLIAENKPADIVSVSDTLALEKNYVTRDSFVEVCELANSTFTASNIKHYAEIVKQKSVDRKMIKAAQSIIQSVNEQKENRLDYAQGLFSELANSITIQVQQIGDLIPLLIEEIDSKHTNPNILTGISTGFSSLDDLTCGLHGGDLIVLAGRPSMGKTLFAMNILEHVVVSEKLTGIIFSLEMSKAELLKRTFASITKLEANKIKTGKMSQPEFAKISETVSKIQDVKLFIDDTPTLSVHEIRAKSKRLKREHGLSLVIIDYLTLMSGEGENETTRIGNITRGLKILARELNVPIIIISQLNRGLEQRNNKRPFMSDLRQSGAIEQDADLILFIYRDEVYNPGNNKGIAEIIVAKHRNGSTGTFNLAFNHQFCRFDEIKSEHLQTNPPKKENVRRGKAFDY